MCRLVPFVFQQFLSLSQAVSVQLILLRLLGSAIVLVIFEFLADTLIAMLFEIYPY